MPEREPVRAVIFDLDGVIVESEHLWDEARRELVAQTGGQWKDGAHLDMMGMSSKEWSVYLRDQLQVPLTADEINENVVAEMHRLYIDDLPLIDGARDVVRLMATRWPLAVASSANRSIIDLVLMLAQMDEFFDATVSSEEVGRGKPAPNVYLAAARAIDAGPHSCVAIEDSGNGIISASDAGMRVVAVPNRDFPPAADQLRRADAIVDSIVEVTPELIEGI